MSGLGVQAQGAIGVESTYGTAVTVTDRLPLKSEDFNKEFERLTDEVLQAHASAETSYQGTASITGSIPLEMNYTEISDSDPFSMDTILALALGACKWDSANTVNQITLDDACSEHATILIDRDTSLWEVVSAKIDTLDLSVSVNSKLEVTAGFKAYDFLNSGLENNQAGMDGLSICTPMAILGSHLEFYLASDFTNALATGDKISIEELKISIKRNLSDNQYATPATGHTKSQLTLEHLPNGPFEVSVEIKVPRYSADTYHNYKLNDTMLQAMAVFTHPTTADYFKIFLPHLRVSDATSPVEGKGMIQQNVSMIAHRRDTDNNVMKFADGSTAINEPIAFELDNDRTAVIL